MKISYFINEITGAGGIRKVTIIKANELAKRGHDVTIVVVNYIPDGFFAEPISQNVRIVPLSFSHSTSKMSIIRTIVNLFRTRCWFKSYIQTERPDFLINVGHSGRFLMMTLPHYNTKFIYELHFNSRYQLINNQHGLKHSFYWFKNWLLYRLAGHRWDRIVLLTEHDLQNDWIGTKDNAIVVPNPVTIHPIVSSLKEKVVISVGRLHFQKNFEQLIRAFALVNKNHPDWQLRIFGDGPNRGYIISLIDNLHLNNIVHLMGLTHEIPLELSKASIFALSSVHEGFCLSVIEALSCGLPIVANDVPGITEIVKGHQCGFLIPFNNHAEMANKICELIESPKLREIMGNNAIQRANDFTLSHIINRWEELFKELIIKKRL